MLEFENLGLIEMDSQEVNEVDGGYTVRQYLSAFHNVNVVCWKAGLGVLAGIGDGIRENL